MVGSGMGRERKWRGIRGGGMGRRGRVELVRRRRRRWERIGEKLTMDLDSFNKSHVFGRYFDLI